MFYEKKHCCENFTNFVNKQLDNKNQFIVIFIDFSKAFDTLQTDKIIESLQCISIVIRYLLRCVTEIL